MKNILLISLTALLWVGCSSKNELETASGVGIEFFTRGEESDQLKNAYVVLMNAHFRTSDDKDIVKSNPGRPIVMSFDQTLTTEQAGLLKEVLENLRVGDSIYFEIPAKNLWEKSFERSLPDSIGQEAMVKVNMGVSSQMTIPEYQQYMAEKEREQNAGNFAAELEGLIKYLETNNIDAVTTDEGLRYVKENETEGALPQEGQMVSVKYKGMLLDGSVFDEGTYTFPLGKGQVIKGWDIGVALFRLGERGILYIPSELGYSSRGSGARIPPYSSLVFEVELVDIK